MIKRFVKSRSTETQGNSVVGERLASLHAEWFSGSGSGDVIQLPRERVRNEPTGSGPRVTEVYRSARRRPTRETGADKNHPGSSAAPPGTLSFYWLLKVPPDASLAKLEKAYRRYVATMHPDRFAHDPLQREQHEQWLREVNDFMREARQRHAAAS